MTYLIDVKRLQHAEVPKCRYCGATFPLNGFEGLLAMVRHGLGHADLPPEDRDALQAVEGALVRLLDMPPEEQRDIALRLIAALVSDPERRQRLIEAGVVHLVRQG